MPHYFFKIHGDQCGHQEQSIELRNDRQAWSEAVRYVGEILQEIDGRLSPDLEWRLDVNDEHHNLIFTLRLTPEVHRSITRLDSAFFC